MKENISVIGQCERSAFDRNYARRSSHSEENDITNITSVKYKWLSDRNRKKNEPEVNLLVFELKVASCFGKAANGDGSRADPRVLHCETSCLGLTGKHSEARCSSLCDACEGCSTPVRAAWLLTFTACDGLFIHLLACR